MSPSRYTSTEKKIYIDQSINKYMIFSYQPLWKTSKDTLYFVFPKSLNYYRTKNCWGCVFIKIYDEKKKMDIIYRVVFEGLVSINFKFFF